MLRMRLEVVGTLLMQQPIVEGRPAHLSAASGLVATGPLIHVVADDALHLATFRFPDLDRGRIHQLLPDPTLPEDEKKRKAKKLIEMESRNQFCDSLEQSDEVKDISVMKSKKKKKKNKNTNSSDSVNNTAEEKNILFGASDNDWNPTEAVIKATPSPSGNNDAYWSRSV